MKSIFFENKWYESNALLFKASNRGFKYGDALFETISFSDNTIWFIEHHLDRLNNASQVLKLHIPKDLNANKLRKLCQDFTTKYGIEHGSLRLQLFRLYGDKYTPKGKDSSYLIEFNTHETALFGAKTQGQTAISFHEHLVQSHSPLSNLKSANSLIYILAKDYALITDRNDCILYNDQKQIVEFSSSNIYLDMGDQILTPPLYSGCLDGVIRRMILQQSQIQIKEADLSAEDLKQANAVYSSNAIEGFKWYSTIDDLTFSKGRAELLNKILRP